jgi:hypothetical protein
MYSALTLPSHFRYILNPNDSDKDDYILLTNGSLFTPFSKTRMLGTSDFCMEVIWEEETYEGEDPPSLPMVCFPAPDAPEDKVSTVRLVIITIGAFLMLIILPIVHFTYKKARMRRRTTIIP